MSCTCQRYQLRAPDGKLLEGELVRDPDCRQHGFPTDNWPAGHPLRRYAQRLNNRLETPRETEQRLYQEMKR